MLKVSKQEILDILKQNNFSEEKAEQILELIAEGLGDSILDIAALAISKIENVAVKGVVSMVYASVEPQARGAIDKIEITL